MEELARQMEGVEGADDARVLVGEWQVEILNCNTQGNTLQHTATHCNTLQDTATHCNALQHSMRGCWWGIGRSIFSKVRSLLNLLQEIGVKLIFENVYQQGVCVWRWQLC